MNGEGSLEEGESERGLGEEMEGVAVVMGEEGSDEGESGEGAIGLGDEIEGVGEESSDGAWEGFKEGERLDEDEEDRAGVEETGLESVEGLLVIGAGDGIGDEVTFEEDKEVGDGAGGCGDAIEGAGTNGHVP